jgi:DnaK suppressor protein
MATNREDPMSKQNAAGDAVFLEQQRKRLVAMRNELVRRASAEAVGRRAAKSDEARESEDDAQDMAQNEIDINIDVVEDRRLRAIERALEKIGEGTYGLSEASGDPIPKARLDAMPEALLTIQEEEAREKAQRR